MIHLEIKAIITGSCRCIRFTKQFGCNQQSVCMCNKVRQSWLIDRMAIYVIGLAVLEQFNVVNPHNGKNLLQLSYCMIQILLRSDFYFLFFILLSRLTCRKTILDQEATNNHCYATYFTTIFMIIVVNMPTKNSVDQETYGIYLVII